VVIAKDSPAHAPDHVPMPAHKRGDRDLVTLFDEAAEELPIREPGVAVRSHGGANMPNDIGHFRRHLVPSFCRAIPSPLQYRERGIRMRDFFSCGEEWISG